MQGAAKSQTTNEATAAAAAAANQNDLVTAQIRGQQITTNFKANYLNRSDIKPTPKRYLILLLFCLHSAINAAQWIYLSSITSTVSKYYQVDNMAINWTSMVYMLVYIPLVVPSTWLFERIGMRDSILLGSFGTTAGSIIKCFSCQPNRFGLLMSGQTLVAVSQLFVLSVPPRLASVWFPDDQVSLANACGVFGNQFGIALGFLVPPMVIDEWRGNLDETRAGLVRLFVGVALLSSTITLLIMFLFDRTPSKAPGLARLQQIKQEEAAAAVTGVEVGATPLVIDGRSGQKSAYGFGALLKDLLTDSNFVLLMASYGLNVGVFYAISTVLNQMITQLWTAQANKLVGQLGLLLVVSGMFGSVVSGIILDRTRLYRLVNASLYTFSLVSLCLFALVLEWRGSMAALYLVVVLLGYFMTGYLFIGYEMSNEITWPRPESVTAGLLNLSAQIFGVVLTYLGSSIVDNYGNLWANSFFIVSLSCGLLITFMLRPQLKRLNAITT